MPDYCTFCEIIAGNLPSVVIHEEDGIIVFRNRLGWFPVQWLLVPTTHMTQPELWASGDLMARIAALAVELGEKHCPNGYRTVSNFGRSERGEGDAMQSQEHAHVHLLGGDHLGLYVKPPFPPPPRAP